MAPGTDTASAVDRLPASVGPYPMHHFRAGGGVVSGAQVAARAFRGRRILDTPYTGGCHHVCTGVDCAEVFGKSVAKGSRR